VIHALARCEYGILKWRYINSLPFPFPKRGTAAPHNFWRMSIVAKRSPISAMAELSSCILWIHFITTRKKPKVARLVHSVCARSAIAIHSLSRNRFSFSVVNSRIWKAASFRIYLRQRRINMRSYQHQSHNGSTTDQIRVSIYTHTESACQDR